MKYFLCRVKILVHKTIDGVESGSSFEEYRLVQAKNEDEVQTKVQKYYKSTDDETTNTVIFSVTIFETIK